MSGADGLARARFTKLLASAGITVDGSAPHDLRVHDERLFTRALSGGSLALGESYMDGWWTCDRLDEFFARVLAAGLDQTAAPAAGGLQKLGALLFPLGRRSRAFVIGERHYDLGNELFEAMLDRRMIYCCAYWRGRDDARRGAGGGSSTSSAGRWASRAASASSTSAAAGAASRVSPPSGTASPSSASPSRRSRQPARRAGARPPGRDPAPGLPGPLGDASYDAVVSIGMFEHVGPRHHRAFLRRRPAVPRARRPLPPSHHREPRDDGGHPDPWILKYIFPEQRTSPRSRRSPARPRGCSSIEDVHNFGPYYDPTLMAWNANVEARRAALPARYDERFFRMWRYYLLSCAGSFRARHDQLLQLVLSPRGVPGGYAPVR